MTSMYFQFLGVQGGYGSSSTAIYGPKQCIALFSIAVPNYLPFRPSSPGCLCWTKKITLNQAFTQQITEPRGTPDRSAHAPFMNHWFTPVLFEIQRSEVITKKPIYWQKTMASVQKPCLCNSFSHLVHNLVWHHQGDLRYRSMAANTVASFDTTNVGFLVGDSSK